MLLHPSAVRKWGGYLYEAEIVLMEADMLQEAHGAPHSKTVHDMVPNYSNG